MIRLKGIYPALITPFTKNGSVNKHSLIKVVNMNINKGVDGFYVGGSTGEAFLLTLNERKQILEIVSEAVGDKCKIISHIGCISTEQTIELGRHAESVGVDAVSAIPPFYYKFTHEEIKNHYYSIISCINLPMILYNFPAFSGVSLDSENIKELLFDNRIIGIKHSSYDLYQLDRMKQTNKNLAIFNGCDEMFLAGLAMGADGGIGSTYNFMAEKFIKIKQLYDKGRHNDAREVQSQINEIIKVILKIGVLQSEKEILNMIGIDCGICKKPFRTLEESEKELLNGLIKRFNLGLI